MLPHLQPIFYQIYNRIYAYSYRLPIKNSSIPYPALTLIYQPFEVYLYNKIYINKYLPIS